MNGIDTFLIQYGLAAIFIIMLVKTIGVPIPIPGDLIIFTAAVRVAQGKLVAWQVFLAIFIALLLGGVIQFVLVRVPGRGRDRAAGQRGCVRDGSRERCQSASLSDPEQDRSD